MRHERFPRAPEPPGSVKARSRAVWASLLPRPRAELMRVGIGLVAALADAAAIVGTGLAVEAVYFHVVYGSAAPVGINAQIGLLVTLFVVIPNIFREEYAIGNYLAWAHHPERVALLWAIAFLIVLTLGFATKTTAEYSRVLVALFFVAGLPALLAARYLVVWLACRSSAIEATAVRRIFLVGYEEDIATFSRHEAADGLGCRVIGATVLRRPGGDLDGAGRTAELDEDIALAVSTVRFLCPDDVFILMPWSGAEALERSVDAFLSVPAALHLRPELVMERFQDIRVARVGRILGLNVSRRPLSWGEVVLKRAFDLVVASLALLLLLPLLAIVAVLIKREDGGPILFRQGRYGFNQQPFSVFKFRSMRVAKEGRFRQATRDDDRVTRIGRFMRRWNIDELPQLLNVLRGEMSLVGPRPHALAHDRAFERRIALYARRHNVKPGITGWAQVNGLRGETRTDEAMRRRIEHDLHYIDHWSLWLDLRILVLTVLSPKAYRDAY